MYVSNPSLPFFFSFFFFLTFTTGQILQKQRQHFAMSIINITLVKYKSSKIWTIYIVFQLSCTLTLLQHPRLEIPKWDLLQKTKNADSDTCCTSTTDLRRNSEKYSITVYQSSDSLHTSNLCTWNPNATTSTINRCIRWLEKHKTLWRKKKTTACFSILSLHCTPSALI